MFPGAHNGGLLAFLILNLVACASVDDEAAHFHMSEALKGRKEGSLKEWRSIQAGADGPGDAAAPLQWAAVATATVASPRGVWLVNSDGSKARLARNFDHVGSAVALTDDGYFLTAAHCVAGDSGCEILAKSGDAKRPRLAVAPVRVVWSSGANDWDLDLALVHAPVRSLRPFDLADVTKVRRGSTVGAVGSSKGLELLKSAAAGKILDVSEVQTHPSGARYRIIQCNVPVAMGDSGGPLFDSDAKLLGVLGQIEGRSLYFGRRLLKVFSYSANVTVPDWQWIQELLDADRAAQKVYRNE